jgi:hypothetical protein
MRLTTRKRIEDGGLNLNPVHLIAFARHRSGKGESDVPHSYNADPGEFT